MISRTHLFPLSEDTLKQMNELFLCLFLLINLQNTAVKTLPHSPQTPELIPYFLTSGMRNYKAVLVSEL
jgi:hypothetical protein